MPPHADPLPPRPTAPARGGPGWPRLLAWATALAVLGATFLAWLRPGVMLDLTNRLMACF